VANLAAADGRTTLPSHSAGFPSHTIQVICRLHR
jgi:hypothetical protein